MLALIVGGLLAWWINGIAPVNQTDKTQKTFSVKKGDSVRIIANNLKTAGLIKDPVIFFLVVKQLRLDQKIQAGDFFLSPSQSAVNIAKSLQTGTYDLRVVIPEGLRAEEIAGLFKDRIETYDDSWRANLVLNEGYLFPDTYSFQKDITIDLALSIMRDNFEAKYAEIPNTGRSRLSKEQIVILGSLLEREAKHDTDRPLVASVMLNRLRIGMPLQIDATVQYALGYQPSTKKWWKKDLTFADLKIDSPYNTYVRVGLPPKAIANPGIEALSAIVNPAQTDYLYYISDKSGVNHYARTLEEHNENIKKYGL